MKKQAYISKSRYMDGLKCPKLIWYKYNRPGDIPPVTEAQQDLFDQGKIVGELAQKMFPDGILIERDKFPEKTAANTAKEIAKRKPLYEAGFVFGNTYALADILVPAGKDKWDLIEVKSTSKYKEEEHLPDVTFQKYVYANNGIKINRCFLMHLNNEYVKKGELDLKELFTKDDITDEVERNIDGVKDKVEELLGIINGPEPKIQLNKNCQDDCQMQPLCWRTLPEDNVMLLYRGKKLGFELLSKGIESIKKIPAVMKLSASQMIQVQAHKSGKPYTNQRAVKEFLQRLKYPLYLLDFETIAPAIPIYDGTSPFENIIVQYSLHIIREKGAKPEHYSYLAPGDVDPRPEALRLLKGLLGKSGSIIGYNVGYEKGCLKSASEAYPEYQDWFKDISNRLVDLLAPFSNFHYYHPAQKGSASIKKVLPALVGTTYEGMEIADGGSARRQYNLAVWGENVAEEEKKHIREYLEKYCAQDTQSMIDIIEKLEEAVK